MLTTAGITFATARTTGSEAGSVGDDDGNGVGVCANKDCTANKRMIAVVDASMRAPPRTIAFNVPLYCILRVLRNLRASNRAPFPVSTCPLSPYYDMVLISCTLPSPLV